MVILKFGKSQSVRLDDAKPVVDPVAEFFESDALAILTTPEAVPATESVIAIAEAVAERGEQYDAENGVVDTELAVALVEYVNSEESDESEPMEPTDIKADEQDAAIDNESTTPKPIPDLQPSYQEQLDDARDEFTTISLETAACESQLKILKAEARASLKRLKNLIDRGSAAASRATVVVKSVECDGDDSDQTAPHAPQSQPLDSDAWRSAPIADLDLGKSLTEKLEENGINTLGELEDLRAKICDRKAEWPKGIGEAKITKIEDAVITWLQSNQQSFVAEEAEAEPESPELMTVPTDQAGSQIVNRADELNTGDVGALDCIGFDATIYNEGMAAKKDGVVLSDCPYVDAGEFQDAWLKGWLKQREIELET